MMQWQKNQTTHVFINFFFEINKNMIPAGIDIVQTKFSYNMPSKCEIFKHNIFR